MAEADVGIAAIAALYQRLMVDDPWSLRTERGFTWWSYRLAQRIEASPVFTYGGRRVSAVRIKTDVANNIDPLRHPADIIAMANMQTTLSALVWDPATGTISEESGMLVDEENAGWAVWLLQIAAVLQNTAAHSCAHAIAEALGGTPSASAHPVNGTRSEPDELLNAPEAVLVNGGEGSGFAAVLDENLGSALCEFGIAGTVAADSLVCELPFRGSRPLSLLDPADSPGVETSLLEVFSEIAHPQFGPGALMTLSLPVHIADAEVALMANRLNLAEAAGWPDARGTGSSVAGALLGAWCPDPRASDRDRVAFNTFLPAALARPGLLEQLIALSMRRSRFAATQLGDWAPVDPEVSGSPLEAIFASVTAAVDAGHLPPWGADAAPSTSDGVPLHAAPDLVVRAMRQAASQVGVAVGVLQARTWSGAVSRT